MSKPYTAPLLINQQKTLTTGFLSKSGYLKPNKQATGGTGWTSNRNKDLDIQITSIMEKDNERIILKYYAFNGQLIEQTIYLVGRLSNLGKGAVWFFICPFNDTICRNLIFVNNRFMHRSNLKNAMYSIQAESKRWRKIFQLMPNIPTCKAYLKEPEARYYKRYYNGKLTKRYKKYLITVQKWTDNQAQRNYLI